MTIAPCQACKDSFEFDPATVQTVLIDPVVERSTRFGGDPDRCVRRPVCPECVKTIRVLGPALLKMIDDLGV